MKAISLPPESADYIKSGRSLQEAGRIWIEDEANLRRLSSPDYVDDEDVQRNAAIQRGEFPAGARKTTAAKVAEAAQKRDESKEVYAVRRGIHDALKKKEEQRVREAMRPVVEVEERKIAESLAQVYSSLKALEQVKGKLTARDFGFWGLPCRLDVDRVFDSVLDPGSDLAVVLRQAVSLGYIKAPEGV